MATINGTNGDDILFGTASNDTISGLAGNDTLVGLGGNNNLSGGDGDDFIYGNFNTNLNLTSVTAAPLSVTIDNTTTNPVNITMMNFTPFKFGSNVLNGGEGNDTLYGNAVNVNLTVLAEDLSITSIANNKSGCLNLLVINQASFGANNLNGGNGNNTLYGNLQDFNYSVISGQTDVSITADNNNITGTDSAMSLVNFSNNKLFSGTGDDVLYGNGHNFLFSVINGFTTVNSDGDSNTINVGTTATSYLKFGNNTLESGAGNDGLFGNFNAANVAIIGGGVELQTSPDSHQGTYHLVNATESLIQFGTNILKGGDGNDVLTGNIHDFAFSVIGLDTFLDASGHQQNISMLNNVSSVATFAATKLYGGNGDDILYGNMHELIYSVIGSNITANSSADNSVSICHSVISKMCFSNNMVDGGSGSNILFGNMQTFEIGTVKGMSDITNASGQYHITNTTINQIDFGNNSLFSTDMSILYGNMESLLFHTGSGSSMLTFGNNLIQGAGTLVASVYSYTMNSATVNSINLCGKIGIQDTAGNTIIWGNSTLSGSDASDTFVFSLANTHSNTAVMQGNNIISNFHNSADNHGDILTLRQYTSGGNLNDHVTLTHSTDGGGTSTTLHFDGGGSIKLLGVNINSLDDIHHLTVT